MNCRASSDRDRLALKVATRRLSRLLGGIEAASLSTRVGHPKLSGYQNRDNATFIPIDVLADLEIEAGSPVVTAELARMTGHVLIEKPPGVARSCALVEFGAAAKEAGEVISRFGDALADDGRVTAADEERLQLRRECHEAIVALVRLDTALEAMVGEAGE